MSTLRRVFIGAVAAGITLALIVVPESLPPLLALAQQATPPAKAAPKGTSPPEAKKPAAPATPPAKADSPDRPNIIFVLVDDLGFADFGCFRELGIQPPDGKAPASLTPAIDALAAQGVRLTQFYSAAPVCSPSRVGIMTGQFPGRHLINTYLNDRETNRRRGMRDFLDPNVPTIARTFQRAGYATAHFGKWHLGGGRDVDDAPLPQAYGFDESYTSFEGLGDRVLPPSRLSEMSAKLGKGEISQAPKHDLTRIYVDRTIDFIDRNQKQPFYIHLWLDDVHDPYQPAPGEAEKFASVTDNPEEQKYFAVLTAMDRQIGRLVQHIDQLKLDKKTLIVLTSDNGPVSAARYYQRGLTPPGSTGGFRGRKISLYEGGIRMPFIARWTGRIPAGSINRTTVLSALDMFPSLGQLAGIDLTKSLHAQGVGATPSGYFDGVNLVDVFTGGTPERTQPLMWEYGRDATYAFPGWPLDESPNLALRDGHWKLLINDDGSRMELYDLSKHVDEFDNVAARHPEIAVRMANTIRTWRRSLPLLDPKSAKKVVDNNRIVYTIEPNTSLDTMKSPVIAGVAFCVEVEATPPESADSPGGVLVAQGDSQSGYALYFREGKLHFTTRVRGQETTLSTEAPPAGKKGDITAEVLSDGTLRLKINGIPTGKTQSPGPIPGQPEEGLDVGRDLSSPVGLYPGPFPWDGTVHLVRVTVDQPPQRRPGHLLTRWAADVDRNHPLPEYPRPQFVRDQWLNLNGPWEYVIAPVTLGPNRQAPKPTLADIPMKWDGRIIVPFCAESVLSGVNRRVAAEQRLWYRRSFRVPADWNPSHRLRLNFGAVDWDTTVWVNGQEVGRHRGGYDPFSFDITDALASTERTGSSTDHEIVVCVWDPTDAGAQPRGKQVTDPQGIWYTPVTGIWQTVWLEPVHPLHLRSLRFTPAPESAGVTIEGFLSTSPGGPEEAEVFLIDGDIRRSLGKTSAAGNIPEPPASTSHGFTMTAAGLTRLWTPDNPQLYDVEVVVKHNGVEVDRVRSYFAMRTITSGVADDGHRRLFLNGQPLFQFGVLDQGWWPDGLYTAPTDDALKFDIEAAKKFGFNMVRKHVKVEPARWYYHCDRLGLLVWQDMPSGGDLGRNHQVRRGQPDIEFTPEESQQFRTELKAMIDSLRNHPSIVVWTPFNEGWGQHDTNDTLDWIRQYDPTRLVNGPSGREDRGAGDLKDLHRYPGPEMFPVMADRVSVLGEFGGLGWPVHGHSWSTVSNWGYRTFASRDDLNTNYQKLVGQLPPLISKGLAAAVYTQITDVESEVNGLMTYDRRVFKLDPEKLTALHAPLYGPPQPRPTVSVNAALAP